MATGHLLAGRAAARLRVGGRCGERRGLGCVPLRTGNLRAGRRRPSRSWSLGGARGWLLADTQVGKAGSIQYSESLNQVVTIFPKWFAYYALQIINMNLFIPIFVAWT